MAVTAAVQDAINEQIVSELRSAYLYLSISAHFESVNLDGFAHWMRLQAQEELGHAIRLFDHLNRAGGRVVLQAIDEPQQEFGTPQSIFEMVLEHERGVTGRIHGLYRLARTEGDAATESALQWFVDEQVEEEDSASRAVHQLRLAGDNNAALLMLDRDFGSRSGSGG